jgi:hypothetical protein
MFTAEGKNIKFLIASPMPGNGEQHD